MSTLDIVEKSSVEVWLWLLMVMQPANPKTTYILRQCKDAVRACRAVKEGVFPFLNENEMRRAEETRNGAISRVLEVCGKNDIRVVTLDDEDYPERLKKIENPPVVLFVKGDINIFKDRRAVAAVGTRTPTDYSREVTKNIVGELAKKGAVIVSGAAVGLDSAAHEAALENNAATAAVMACGLLYDYPRETAGLRKIIAEKGAVISEFLPPARVFTSNFHSRNRIISGLCDCALVLQASDMSGALVTAQKAFEQNRRVFYIPPADIFAAEYSGAAVLARSGAEPAFRAEDIRAALESSAADGEEFSAGEEKPPKAKKAPKRALRKASGERRGASEKKAAEEEKEADFSALEPNERKLAELILRSPAGIDALVERSELDYETVCEALTVLELSGVIVRKMDGVFSVLK